jgi:hypothetical protein
MSATRDGTPDEGAGPAECWCCGDVVDRRKTVQLGNHPEVTICVRCAYSLKNWAWEIEDRSKSGPLVRVRAAMRRVRRNVMHRGWHRSRWLGGPVRWLGRRLP